MNEMAFSQSNGTASSQSFQAEPRDGGASHSSGDRRVIAIAPGRINLIGEHTDYNGGYVLPMAIDRQVSCAISARHDGIIAISAADLGQTTRIDLETNPDPTDLPAWAAFVYGAWVILSEHVSDVLMPDGITVAFSGNVPIGAGLSSSAALSVALLSGIAAVAGIPMEPLHIAKLAPEIESRFAGVNCGLMDPFTSAMSKADHAVFLDCGKIEFEYYPLKSDQLAVVAVDCGVKHELVDSEYNMRRSTCESAAKKLLGKPGYLTDVTDHIINEKFSGLTDAEQRLVRHVRSENARVKTFCKYLKQFTDTPSDELGRELGTLLYASHASLRNDYRVSIDELDILVELASHCDGVYGSRMTGGGFGGATINLVKPDSVAHFKAHISTEYKAKTGIDPRIWVFKPSQGAVVLEG